MQQKVELERLFNYLDDQFLLAVDITVSREEVERVIYQNQIALLESFAIVINSLDKFYKRRIEAEQKHLYLLLALVIAFVIVAAYLFVGMSLSIAESVGVFNENCAAVRCW